MLVRGYRCYLYLILVDRLDLDHEYRNLISGCFEHNLKFPEGFWCSRKNARQKPTSHTCGG